MSPIDEQRDLINKLYFLLIENLTDSYNTASCWFDYRRSEDGSTSIGSRLSFTHNEQTKYGRLNYQAYRVLDDLIPKLHAAMKAHTGGDWNAFTLMINTDGSVTTKFEYPEDAPASL